MREFLGGFAVVLVLVLAFGFFVSHTAIGSTPPRPVIRIGEPCLAKSVSMTIRLDRTTYRISTIEVCGQKIVLRGRAVR